MATLDTDEANLIDAEPVNWRAIVYPLLAVLIVGFGALGYYYYLQDQRNQLEDIARIAVLQAKTPEEFIKVADQYPKTTQASLALMQAAALSFEKKDFAAATADFQKIVQNTAADAQLKASAQLGLASSFEASGKQDDAINTLLEVGHLGAKSPFAPYALYAAARLYEEKGDKDNQRKILSEAAALDPESVFVKQAQAKLNELTPKAAPSASTLAPIPTATVTSQPQP